MTLDWLRSHRPQARADGGDRPRRQPWADRQPGTSGRPRKRNVWSRGIEDVRPLTRQAAEALATRGYIDVADPLAGECEALFWRHTADLEGLDARLASILSARTPPPACLVNPGPGRRAWLPVQHLRL